MRSGLRSFHILRAHSADVTGNQAGYSLTCILVSHTQNGSGQKPKPLAKLRSHTFGANLAAILSPRLFRVTETNRMSVGCFYRYKPIV